MNEALGNLGRSGPLVATLDLGGASTQIAMPLPTRTPGPFRFDVVACKDAANCQDDADACTYAGALLRLPEVQGASPLLYPSAQLNARQALPCTPCLALASA